ncbi:MAG: electron transfer flavoprotein-ubiquinone oxidoreductase, partial [bacterium]|nr:electron transfer flavoprotein-ubiquinone oxidoreductase [bacterium]
MNAPIEREIMEVDVLFVGAGPATLASAYHLVKTCEERGIEAPAVLVIEKSAEVGDHMLSGACVNPRGIRELMPDFLDQGFPLEFVCDKPQTHVFLPNYHFRLPINPPEFAKRGYMVASLNKVAKWLAGKCEELGVDIYSGFSGDRLLLEGDKVVGVRLGDMGIDKDGKQKGTFQAGMDIQAKVTVLGEGVRGSLTKQLVSRFGLEGDNPQIFETGIKEIWRVKPENHVPGRVVHGMVPLDLIDAFGGMFLYDMQDNLVSFGVVTALESSNPFLDPHLRAQKVKTNPFFRKLFDGAELVRYGAKTIPIGGLTSMPKLYTDGALLIGDSAGFCNGEKLSGVHLAMKSGMMAAETIADAVQADDFTSVTLGGYTERYRQSWAFEEHWKTRTHHASFASSFAFTALNEPFRRFLTDGGGLLGMPTFHAGHEAYTKLSELPPEKRVKEEFEFDGVLTFSKEHLVGFSGTAHEADQPSHLVVADKDLCSDVCTEEYGNPCVSFCPAAVYEMMDDPETPGKKQLFIH